MRCAKIGADGVRDELVYAQQTRLMAVPCWADAHVACCRVGRCACCHYCCRSRITSSADFSSCSFCRPNRAISAGAGGHIVEKAFSGAPHSSGYTGRRQGATHKCTVRRRAVGGAHAGWQCFAVIALDMGASCRRELCLARDHITLPEHRK